MINIESGELSDEYAKYIVIAIGYIFCFYNFFNTDDPYGMYLIMISLLIITTLFGIYLTMDIENNGLYNFIKSSILLSGTSMVVTSCLILNFVSIAIFLSVFDYGRKFAKGKDRKFIDPTSQSPPYMISKMSIENETLFSNFKKSFIISTIFIFFILAYFGFIISTGLFNRMYLYGEDYIANLFIIINMAALVIIEGFLLYYSIMETIYSSEFLKNKKRNIDIYPVVV